MAGGEPRVPRSSAQVVRSSLDELAARRRRAFWRRVFLSIVVLGALVWGGNYMLAGRPVTTALRSDPRTAPLAVSAHLRWYVDPTTLIYDLTAARVADSTDLWTGLLLSAQTLASGLSYQTVVLARNGVPIYTLDGADFRSLARDYTNSRKPVQVLRTLVTMLRRPGGAKLSPLMDARGAALPWATGTP